MLQDYIFSISESGTPDTTTADFESLGSYRAPFPLVMRREIYTEGLSTGKYLHHDFYALYLVRSGQGTHWIDERSYAMTRGDCYMMTPNAKHEYRDYKNLQIDAFYFQPDAFHDDEQNALRELGGFWNLMVPSSLTIQRNEEAARLDHRLHLTPERYAQTETIIAEMRSEIEGGHHGALLVRGLFFRLLMWLSRWHAQQNAERESTSVARDGKPERFVGGRVSLAEVLLFCEEHFAEPLSVPQLAALLFVTPQYFSKLFTREVGMPPAAYLRRLRLERAQTLLRDSDLPIAHIAQQTGFGTSEKLSHAFRAVYGTTPTAFRAAAKR